MNTNVLQETCWSLVGGTGTETTGGGGGGGSKEIRQQLEKGNDVQKAEAMRVLLASMVSGADLMPELTMHVIRFVLPSRNKSLKKLLLLYWEVCQKKSAHDGKLRQEMILVCNYLRNDLHSSNEFVRAATMRLVAKLTESELLEPLLPSIRLNLEHRHPLVRKNAVVALGVLHRQHSHFIPDAPDLLADFLTKEQDMHCRRAAFVALCHMDHARALHFLKSIFAQLTTALDETFQLAVIELIKKDSTATSVTKAAYLSAIISLLESATPAVRFEAASTLINLTSSASAVLAVGKCYIDLAVKESDNNVKLIVLERLDTVRARHEAILDDLAMDLLRVLSSSDMGVCKKATSIVLSMLSSRNISSVIQFFKNQFAKSSSGADMSSNANAATSGSDHALELRHLLIHAVHECAIRFPQAAAEVVEVLMDYLGEDDSFTGPASSSSSSSSSAATPALAPSKSAAVDVIAFIKEVVERNPHLRPTILQNLFQSFPAMKVGKVLRGALWVLGEYCDSAHSIEQAMVRLRQSLGEVPIVQSEQRLLDDEHLDPHVGGAPTDADGNSVKSPAQHQHHQQQQRRVLADGTYATESALVSLSPHSASGAPAQGAAKKRPPLRQLIMAGDYFLASVLANTLTKLVLRASLVEGLGAEKVNALRAEAMLIMTSVVRVGQSNLVTAPIDEDSYDRILICLRVLGQHGSVSGSPALDIFLKDCHRVYADIVKSDDRKQRARKSKEKQDKGTAIDQQVQFRQLKSKIVQMDAAAAYAQDLLLATGAADMAKVQNTNRLNRIVQLSGFSDPVYAEAFVDVHQFDILLDVLIVNQTNETLQNLTIEFATLGDLKLVERPTPTNMGPYAFHTLKANIKVSSTETGVIFGNIVYDSKAKSDSTVIVLNDIHIDIMDYIHPPSSSLSSSSSTSSDTLSETQFRAMWTEFEWENKITVNTNIRSIRAFLEHILKETNMRVLTPGRALEGECGFLSANVYARSIFGEDALANISLEQVGGSNGAGVNGNLGGGSGGDEGSVQGAIRIRSKTQGIALSLGDKITLSQKIRV